MGSPYEKCQKLKWRPAPASASGHPVTTKMSFPAIDQNSNCATGTTFFWIYFRKKNNTFSEFMYRETPWIFVGGGILISDPFITFDQVRFISIADHSVQTTSPTVNFNFTYTLFGATKFQTLFHFWTHQFAHFDQVLMTEFSGFASWSHSTVKTGVARSRQYSGWFVDVRWRFIGKVACTVWWFVHTVRWFVGIWGTVVYFRNI